MPNWKDILIELQLSQDSHPLDFVRRKYLKNLHKKRGRNIIAYYSGWLQQKNFDGTNIDDGDKNAFMTTIHRLDRSKGLDLILHTPGGEVAATESIVNYLIKMFDRNIEVFVPQMAMSLASLLFSF